MVSFPKTTLSCSKNIIEQMPQSLAPVCCCVCARVPVCVCVSDSLSAPSLRDSIPQIISIY